MSELKIDRSFVSNLQHGSNDAVIVRSVIDLGHNLGLHVVAEGIEDAETWELLKHLGCDSGQGCLLSMPVSANRLEAWLCEETSQRHLKVVGGSTVSLAAHDEVGSPVAPAPIALAGRRPSGRSRRPLGKG